MLDWVISFYADFFRLLVSVLGSYGLAILSLSILSALAMLKLNRWAEQSARTEQEYQEVFAPQIDRLKQELSGDVYHKALRQLYRRYSYHPFFAIRQVLPLLIQLPFLILTYLMLSERPELVGQSFLGIQDLSQPDALIAGINLLPLAMTAFNIATAFLLPRVKKKQILQAVGISLLFLVLLYDANAGILLYWTFNNLIQLGKALIRSFDKGIERGGDSLLEGISIRRYLPDTLLLLAFVFLFLTLQAYLELLAVEDTPRTHIKTVLIFLICFSGLSTLGIVFKRFQSRALSICLIGGGSIAFGGIATLLLISPHQLIKMLADFIFYYNLIPLYLFPPVVLTGFSFAVYILIKRQNNLERNAYFTFSIGASIAALSFHWLNNSVFLFAQTVPFYFIIGVVFAIGLALLTYPFVRAIEWPAASWEVLGGTLLFALIMLPTLHAILIWSSHYLEYALLIALSYLLFSYLYRQGRRIVYSFFVLFTLINLVLLAGQNFLGEEQASLETEIGQSPDTQKIQKRIERFNGLAGNIADRPNIYFLVSESMPDLNTLEKLGIDAFPLKSLLQEYGFKTYENTYTVGPMSLPSMSRTLDIRAQISDGDEMRKIVGGHSIANLWLQDIGYQSAIVTKTFMTGIYNAYDIRKPDVSVTAGKMDFLLMLLKGVALREFKFDIKGLKRYGKNIDYESIKHELIKTERQEPFFMVYHGEYPGHSQNSGQCLPDEKERFVQRYYKAIKLLRADLKLIKKHDPNALVVIMGDHGPYLTGNCHTLNYTNPAQVTELDLRDRVGTIFSVHWPDPLKAEKYDREITINQDFFPVLFSYLYDNPAPLSLRIPSQVTLGGRSLDNGQFLKRESD